MKVGKVPENVLKRSVFKQLHTTRKEVLLGAGVGEDCAAMKLAEDEVFLRIRLPEQRKTLGHWQYRLPSMI